MRSRRELLIRGAEGSAVALLAINLAACVTAETGRAIAATAITQVFGDGAKLVAVAIEHDAPIDGSTLVPANFSVEGRTVTGAFASTSADPGDRVDKGRFVIVTLSPDDATAGLSRRVGQQPDPAGGGGTGGPGGRGPGKAGDLPADDTTWPSPVATITPARGSTLTSTKVENLIVDDFRQLEFDDPQTGKRLRYNLFVPEGYDAGTSYPLLLFMHDAGATSDVTRTTLFQGLGAITWASPEDQAKRPCFVLAPQFAETIADDESRTSGALDATINLIKALTKQYSIDPQRLYTTGQSGGCMMSIAMDIKYPDFFAASFLVAGQWDPALVKPLARKKLWILVSQDDDKAFPGQNAITAVLEREGAKISRAVWDGTWTPDQFRAAFDRIDAENSPINYVTFAPGTVIPAGQSAAGASGHRNTWRIAYTIEPIREWIFRQHR